MPVAHRLFALDPLVVGALHLPDLGVARDTSIAALEDYMLANARVFAEAGVPALMLQDQTREPGAAAPITLTIMASLGRLLRREFPAMELGIIVQAHDAIAPLAIAHATGASFVRMKIFVAASMTAEGPRTALAPEARLYRHTIHAEGVAILADVFDRTSVPMVDASPERAAQWAASLGADGLILTGDSYADSLARIRKARESGVKLPVLLGGSVTEQNVADALSVADGVIVSTSLMRTQAAAEDLLKWDIERATRFMAAARKAR